MNSQPDLVFEEAAARFVELHQELASDAQICRLMSPTGGPDTEFEAQKLVANRYAERGAELLDTGGGITVTVVPVAQHAVLGLGQSISCFYFDKNSTEPADIFWTGSEGGFDLTCPFIEPEKVGEKFARLLREAATDKDWEDMLSANAEETNPLVCHSHDFTDANVVMEEAFHNLDLKTAADFNESGPAVKFARDGATWLWNAAWDWAKANRLTKQNQAGDGAEAAAPEANNIWDYFFQKLGVNLPTNDAGLDQWELESVCGQASRQIIDRAKALLEVCDPHPEVRNSILQGVTTAIEIVCFG